MKLNIFSIPPENVDLLKLKLDQLSLDVLNTDDLGSWSTSFYFSENAEPTPISWVETFKEFFPEGNDPKNQTYFGVYLFERKGQCFAISFGKAHFYIRAYCEHDYGIEMAKRIASEKDVKQTASKKFAGKKKKEIKSYNQNTALDIESGESIDYIRAAIADDKREMFGKSGQFGASLLINFPGDKENLGDLFDALLLARQEEEKFKLPRTVTVSDPLELEKYNGMLLSAIKSTADSTSLSDSTHEIIGVDFVFAGHQSYEFQCWGHSSQSCESLDLVSLRQYIQTENLSDEEILKVRVKVKAEGQRAYSKSLQEALEYIIDDEMVVLSQGRWVRFNEDYLEQLDEYIDAIEVEETESQFLEIEKAEGDFNASQELKDAGYESADKDFTKIKVNASIPIEAWDLSREGVAYAVKFGTAQKLSYVCDQALAVLEVIRNKANIKKLDKGIQSYCLWLGFDRSEALQKISETKSIILKQKIEAWAHKCREVGFEPKIKMSRKVAK